MLMCSFVHFYFVCEHLFTFHFCALMHKISKENLAGFPKVKKFEHWTLENGGKKNVIWSEKQRYQKKPAQ